MKKMCYKKGIVFGIILLFVGISLLPSIGGSISKNINFESQDDIQLTIHYVGINWYKKIDTIALSQNDMDMIFDKFEYLKYELSLDPFSDSSKVVINEFINLLDECSLIPLDVSKNDIEELFNPKQLENINKKSNINYATKFSKIIQKIRNVIFNKLPESFVKILQDIKNKYNSEENIVHSVITAEATAEDCRISGGVTGRISHERESSWWGRRFTWDTEGRPETCLVRVREIKTGNGFDARSWQHGIAYNFFGLWMGQSFHPFVRYDFQGFCRLVSVIAEQIDYINARPKNHN